MQNKTKILTIALFVALLIGFVLGWYIKPPVTISVIPPGSSSVHRIDTQYVYIDKPAIITEGKAKVKFRTATEVVNHDEAPQDPHNTLDSSGSFKFIVNIFNKNLCVAKEYITFKELDSYILTRPFEASLDTISHGDTLKQKYLFPENIFASEYHPKPDTTKIVYDTTYIKTPTPWYDETWARVTSYIFTAVATAYVVRK